MLFLYSSLQGSQLEWGIGKSLCSQLHVVYFFVPHQKKCISFLSLSLKKKKKNELQRMAWMSWLSLVSIALTTLKSKQNKIVCYVYLYILLYLFVHIVNKLMKKWYESEIFPMFNLMFWCRFSCYSYKKHIVFKGGMLGIDMCWKPFGLFKGKSI